MCIKKNKAWKDVAEIAGKCARSESRYLALLIVRNRAHKSQSPDPVFTLSTRVCNYLGIYSSYSLMLDAKHGYERQEAERDAFSRVSVESFSFYNNRL